MQDNARCFIKNAKERKRTRVLLKRTHAQPCTMVPLPPSAIRKQRYIKNTLKGVCHEIFDLNFCDYSN